MQAIANRQAISQPYAKRLGIISGACKVTGSADIFRVGTSEFLSEDKYSREPSLLFKKLFFAAFDSTSLKGVAISSGSDFFKGSILGVRLF